MVMAVRSCNRPAQRLRDLHGKSEEFLNVTVSYDEPIKRDLVKEEVDLLDIALLQPFP